MSSIFISHASPDAAIANTIVGNLEAAGLRCWIAPRNVVPGALYADEIVRAINDSSLVVLVLSAHSVASAHVGKELERASSKGRRIIALRTDTAALPPAFEYFLSESQWIELGAGGLDAAAHRLTEAAQRYIGAAPAAAATPAPATAPATRPARRNVAMAAVAAVALLLAGAGIFWGINHGGEPVSARQSTGTSLAVLPFVDLSPEQDQGYFSDGLSEELLNQLAQFRDLRLTARTSSFSFKGKNEDVRVIGQKLGVAHVLEGSVRKSGERLRITAQLIDTSNGTQLWSQTFDRNLTDVFAMQDEIAKAVTRTLSVALDVGDMSRARGGTTSIEAYDKYLRARELDRRRGGADDFLQASQFYREAVQIDPAFIRAWADLYNELDSSLIYLPENAATARAEMTRIVEHLEKEAPADWRTRVVRAARLMEQRKWREADAQLTAARDSGADLAASTINTGYVFLLNTGRLEEALPYQVRRREADPLALNSSYATQIVLFLTGRDAEADAEYQRSKGLEGNHTLADSFTLRRMMARPNADAAAIEAHARSLPAGVTGSGSCGLQVVTRDQKAGAEFIRQALASPATQTATSMLELAGCADYIGERELALRALTRSYVDLHGTNVGMLWQPWKSSLRAEPGFKQLLRDIGLADYFRASGKWGDRCKPLGDSDFECQ